MSALEEYRSTFGEEYGYLNWAAYGLLSPAITAEAVADAELLGSPRPASHTLVHDRVPEARELLAEMLDVSADAVTLQPSATYGLMHALYGLSGEVLAASSEFPSITVSLERAAAFGKARARWMEFDDGHPLAGFMTPDAVAAALDDDVTALVVSHVDFRTGYRTDLSALREVLGPDRLLIVDAVQSFGVLEADYAAADVVVGHGYKWLRAGRGTGFATFSARARERITPVLSGFGGVDGGLPLDVLPAPSPSANAYTVASPDQLAVARLAMGLTTARDAGVAAIEAALMERTDRLFEIADSYGIAVQTPREYEQRAGIVTFLPENPAQLAASLANAGVRATARGTSIRVSAHVGTSDDTLAQLDEAIGSAGYEKFTSE